MAIETTGSFQPSLLVLMQMKTWFGLGFCPWHGHVEKHVEKTQCIEDHPPPHPPQYSYQSTCQLSLHPVTMLISHKETESQLAESSLLLWVTVVQNILGGNHGRDHSLHCVIKKLRFRKAQWNCVLWGQLMQGKRGLLFTKPDLRTFPNLSPSTTIAHYPTKKSKARMK